MCGITGFINSRTGDCKAIAQRMVKTLHHRGPDDSGVWADEVLGVALAHARLSILDLSPTGHQPMVSQGGHYVISFNGEIYNYRALRQEIEQLGVVFSGRSDTEVMLACINQWGLETATKRFNGMFSFALWDRKERRLYLVRDRLGKKPVYYGWMGETFIFGSELKSLSAYPEFRGEINRDALALYLRYNYIPAPYSIYRNIYKLQPGTILAVSDSVKKPLVPVPYWSLKEVAETGLADPFCGTEAQAVSRLEAQLLDAVELRMEADVPLGVLLSGGVDSSLVAALMQIQNARPVKTFTIGFNETGYNEAVYARAVARHLGTDHTELYVTPKEAMASIPRLPMLYDEPFADVSQIPTFLICQMARQKVTVCLTGDGGDEIFGGYNRYFIGPDIWRKASWLPVPCRKAVAGLFHLLSPDQWEKLAFVFSPFLKQFGTQGTFGDKFYKIADILAMKNPDELYRRLLSHWEYPEQVLKEGREAATILNHKEQWARLPNFTERMMYLDTLTYLPDDILVKVDRASMGVSLEVRSPLLDYRVVESLWQIPLSMKIRKRSGKWLLRQVLYKYVPSKLIERPKAGFGVPMHDWLRGPLRGWAEALLDEHRLKEEGFFNSEVIRKKWVEHLSGKRNWLNYLWNILMFQAWLSNENKYRYF